MAALFTRAEDQLEGLDHHHEGTHDEDRIAQDAEPAQVHKSQTLHDFFATSVPETFRDTGRSLNDTDRQEARHDHQH